MFQNNKYKRLVESIVTKKLINSLILTKVQTVIPKDKDLTPRKSWRFSRRTVLYLTIPKETMIITSILTDQNPCSPSLFRTWTGWFGEDSARNTTLIQTYKQKTSLISDSVRFFCDLSEIQTRNRRLRRALLYSVELRGQIKEVIIRSFSEPIIENRSIS